MKHISIVEDYKKIHFIGIGGVNMSALAELLHKSGYAVSGSDKNPSENTARLQALGIDVFIGHNPQNISENTEIVVYNAAVGKDNPEYARAVELGVYTIDRGKLLGLIMKNYEFPICVAGSHGKTTTTSMLAEIFIHAQKSPTVANGGVLDSIGGTLAIGEGPHFIAEACEYHDSFLDFFPHFGIILNIDMDHPDYFQNLAALRASFRAFAERIPHGGRLFINSDINHLPDFVEGLECDIVTFGNSGIYSAQNIIQDNADMFFDFCKDNTKLARIHLLVPGLHNVEDALAAAACSHSLGISADAIKDALAKFTGARRRFQRKGQLNEADIIDDYAHHPSEISATLEAAKNMGYKRVYAVFQPHTQSRTQALLPEFAESLAIADEIILLDIFAPTWREEADAAWQIHSRDLDKELEKYPAKHYYFASFEAAKAHLQRKVAPKELILTLGAGDVYRLGEELALS